MELSPDRDGKVVLRKRLNRAQLGEFAGSMATCRVAMESCPGSQYWGRCFAAAGHEVRIIPAQFVKPYVKSNKNDYNDAEAIAEAGSRGTMRCVPPGSRPAAGPLSLAASGCALLRVFVSNNPARIAA